MKKLTQMTYKSRVYTDRPAYADYAAPEKFMAIQSIIAKHLTQHPKAICSYSGGADVKGKPVRLGTTYHSTIGQAVQAYYNALQRDAVRGGTMTLPEAVDVFTAILDGVRGIRERLDGEGNEA